MVYFYFVTDTGDLTLYFTGYYGFVDDISVVYAFDRGCEGGDLASRLDG